MRRAYPTMPEGLDDRNPGNLGSIDIKLRPARERILRHKIERRLEESEFRGMRWHIDSEGHFSIQFPNNIRDAICFDGYFKTAQKKCEAERSAISERSRVRRKGIKSDASFLGRLHIVPEHVLSMAWQMLPLQLNSFVLREEFTPGTSARKQVLRLRSRLKLIFRSLHDNKEMLRKERQDMEILRDDGYISKRARKLILGEKQRLEKGIGKWLRIYLEQGYWEQQMRPRGKKPFEKLPRRMRALTQMAKDDVSAEIDEFCCDSFGIPLDVVRHVIGKMRRRVKRLRY